MGKWKGRNPNQPHHITNIQIQPLLTLGSFLVIESSKSKNYLRFLVMF